MAQPRPTEWIPASGLADEIGEYLVDESLETAWESQACLDTGIAELVGKVADGVATEPDRAKLAQLSSSRVRLMRRR